MNLLDKFNNDQIAKVISDRTTPFPSFRPGDLLKVILKITDGVKERLQTFEGRCIAKRNRGFHSCFRLRKVVAGNGVEIILPLYSPHIHHLEVLKTGLVRRAKLYYLRDRSAKESRIPERDAFVSKKLARVK